MSETLRGSTREKTGSRHARALRGAGRLPATVQGEDKPNLNLSIEEDAFLAARRHHEHLLDIEVAGHGVETVLVRELQWDELGDRILHVEFRRVVRGQKTEVEVELEFSGHPAEGVLNHLETHVTLMALPSDIPDSIEVKVDGLDAGHPIHAGDLVLPDGVDLVTDADIPVAVVSHVRAEVEEPAEGEEEALEGAAAAPAEGEEGAEEPETGSEE